MKNKKKAFTLLELVIVLAIISILLLIAIPGAKKFRESANIKADEMNKKTIQEAVIMYNLTEEEKLKAGKLDENNALVTKKYLEKLVTKPTYESDNDKYYNISYDNEEIVVN